MWWVIGRLFRRLAILSALALVGLALYTQYAFQEPFLTTWSRYLRPQLDWQKGKYPSLAPAFAVVEALLPGTDPRDRFAPAAGARAVARPANWETWVVGPRKAGSAPPPGNDVLVGSPRELTAAIEKAAPGTAITMSPGTYDFKGRSIEMSASGTPERPIVLRAPALGAVTLRLNMLEGLHVRGAHWIIENLLIEGVCPNDDYCEHAFHVVGGARGTVIRNNWVANFNSSVKVNGARGVFPDGGAILDNAFVNDRPRRTDNPVTVIDLVAADGWVVAGNFIADFAKGRGDRTSYGAFFKGAGEGNVFERNLVRCEWRHRGGTRIGFSFGGGGTTPEACRDRRCAVEHRQGILRSNVIMDCPNDVGIYLNKGAASVIHNNLILNTRGIDVRYAASSAEIFNNVIDGRILARDDGTYTGRANAISTFDAALDRDVSDGLFADPDAGDLRATDPASLVGAGVPLGTPPDGPAKDFCGRPYAPDARLIGPFQYGPDMGCRPVLP